MRFFNSFQLLTLFAIGPFLITYNRSLDYYAHNVVTWVFIVGYIVGFGAIASLIADNIHKD